MILIFTYAERNPRTGVVEDRVDHAVNIDTGKAVIMPQGELIGNIPGAVWDDEMMSYVIRNPGS